MKTTGSWMSDVQRVLALVLIGTLATITLVASVAAIRTDPQSGAATIDMAKTLQQAMVNMGLIALGFFFGNTIAKMQQDTSQQRLTDKLTSTAPGTLPPAPSGNTGGAPVPPWWSRLTDSEKTAISNASNDDARVASIISAMQVGAATPDDLDYLVTKSLLTNDRSAAIKTG